VINAVRERNFIYIDGTMLDVPYTGIDRRYKGGTWWIRFFDYCDASSGQRSEVT
jgi:hypothetical protein